MGELRWGGLYHQIFLSWPRVLPVRSQPLVCHVFKGGGAMPSRARAGGLVWAHPSCLGNKRKEGFACNTWVGDQFDWIGSHIVCDGFYYYGLEFGYYHHVVASEKLNHTIPSSLFLKIKEKFTLISAFQCGCSKRTKREV